MYHLAENSLEDQETENQEHKIKKIKNDFEIR